MGRTIAGYEIERPLGRGGMAETFLAVRRAEGRFEQRCCLKQILPGFAEDAEFIHSFVEEARLSAQLRHHNIVQVLDFGTGETNFIAMELIEGCNLRELAAYFRESRKLIPAGLIAHFALELGQALAYAHDHQVVHRDISPANVLASDAGEIKLSDFGIAKALGRAKVTQAGVVKGKIPYMAPEYASGGGFDARCDIYALGVTLFELASLQRPYQGKSNVDTLMAATNGDHADLRRLTDLPEELCALIHQCISPRIETRPQTAQAFLDALETCPPPPTSRRLLGQEVTRAAAHKKAGETPKHQGEEAYADTAYAQDAVEDTAIAEQTAALPIEHTMKNETAGDGTDTKTHAATDSPELSKRTDHTPMVIPAPPEAETRTNAVPVPATLPDTSQTSPPPPTSQPNRWLLWPLIAFVLFGAALLVWLLS